MRLSDSFLHPVIKTLPLPLLRQYFKEITDHFKKVLNKPTIFIMDIMDIYLCWIWTLVWFCRLRQNFTRSDLVRFGRIGWIWLDLVGFAQIKFDRGSSWKSKQVLHPGAFLGWNMQKPCVFYFSCPQQITKSLKFYKNRYQSHSCCFSLRSHPNRNSIFYRLKTDLMKSGCINPCHNIRNLFINNSYT